MNHHGDTMQTNKCKYSNLGLSLVLMLTTAQVWGAEAGMPNTVSLAGGQASRLSGPTGVPPVVASADRRDALSSLTGGTPVFRSRSAKLPVLAGMPAPAPTPPAKGTTASQPNVAGQEDPAELAAVLTKLDRKLLDKNEQDIRAWLDARIAATGDFGVYSFGYDSVKVQGDTAKVDLNRGALGDSAAQFIRAYEMLGEKKWRS